MALDGHFNPLTSLAVHLKRAGHDVRWYTGKAYHPRLQALDIPHYPFVKALDINQNDVDETFPERKAIKGQMSKLVYDIKHVFILRSPEFYEDLKGIDEEFPFDVVIADIAFTGIPFLREKMNKPVMSVGVFPVGERSKDLPPNGLGMCPSASFTGRIKQDILRLVSDKVIFGSCNKLMRNIFDEYGIKNIPGNVFDILYRKSSMVLQIGTPGFEYQRSDLAANIRFIGPLLPDFRKRQTLSPDFMEKIQRHEKVILVTQGTVEKDPQKIIVPVLEALKDSAYLVIATTGSSGTAMLRKRFPQKNIIIEDFIPFTEVMPYCDVYITNGGYGGVMLGIGHQLPMIAAGIHEGKNEICARIGYFNLGINLRTEYPSAVQIWKSVEKILNDPLYKRNVVKLREEFKQYPSRSLVDKYLEELLEKDAVSEDVRLNLQPVLE